MQPPLFRPEVLERRRRARLFGEVMLIQPLSAYALSALAALVGLLVIFFLFTATFASKERVVGYLVPDKGLVKVFAPRDGIYADVRVKDGDLVTAGQVLASIVADQATSAGEVGSAVLKELDQEIATAEGRRAAELARRDGDARRLAAKTSALEEEQRLLAERLVNQKQRLALAEQGYTALKGLLAQKFITKERYDAKVDEYLSQKQALIDIDHALADGRNKLQEARFEQSQLGPEADTRMAALDSTLAELRQRRAEADGRRSALVVAPTAGRVTALLGAPGQRASTSQPLLTVLPQEARLEARLLVPTRAIGFVAPGEVVRILYDAFPYERFGVHTGKVTTVPRSTVIGSELPVPNASGEPVYCVTVTLDRQAVEAYGKEVPLQAGMLLKADVIFDQRPLVAWVLEPLLAAKGGLL